MAAAAADKHLEKQVKHRLLSGFCVCNILQRKQEDVSNDVDYKAVNLNKGHSECKSKR